ncbi:MAG: glycosyltransferase [Desulfuromonadales bacterium]|nr:glycosyltransferase [Desulfuromonadales bacterium]
MHLLIVVPPQVRTTGNRVTAKRLSAGVKALGHMVTIVPAEPAAISVALERGVDLALLLHAYRSGQPWLESGATLPYLVLLTGTDYHDGLRHPLHEPVIRDVLRRAELIVIKNQRDLQSLAQDHPECARRLRYVAPGVVLGDAPCALRDQLGLSAPDLLLLCPAGIRPVKGVLTLLELCDPVAYRRAFHVAFCGPILDKGYGEQFLAAVAARHWAHYVGKLPPAAIPAAMRQADVVLNNSVSEGLPNALVEAAALGRPILAHAISGNAAVVTEGVNGMLYRDATEFTAAVIRLIDEPALRARLSQPNPERFSAKREAQAFAELCMTVLEEHQLNK